MPNWFGSVLYLFAVLNSRDTKVGKIPPIIIPFTVSSTSTLPVTQATVCKACLTSLSLDSCVQTISKIYPFKLHDLSRILQLFTSTVITLIQATFISHLDYCNQLLKILPAVTFVFSHVLSMADTVVPVNHRSD